MRPEIAQEADPYEDGQQCKGREEQSDPLFSISLGQLMMLPASIPLALLAAASFTDRLARSLNNKTFAGIHQLDWFDWSLLIPYFATLAILSVYGLHRYDIIRTYFGTGRTPPKTPRCVLRSRRW
jgi:hypothetical protein